MQILFHNSLLSTKGFMLMRVTLLVLHNQQPRPIAAQLRSADAARTICFVKSFRHDLKSRKGVCLLKPDSTEEGSES